MAASCQSGEWLVILNQSLADSELHRLLQAHQHKIKGTLTNTVAKYKSMTIFKVVGFSELKICMKVQFLPRYLDILVYLVYIHVFEHDSDTYT